MCTAFTIKHRLSMGILALQVLMAASLAHAQGDGRTRANGYPSKSVRVIVPLAPGGGSDIVARIISSVLVDHWGQSVVVDNRPGAGSTVGTAIAAKAAADGYTLLVTSSSIAISPALVLYPRPIYGRLAGMQAGDPDAAPALG